MLIFFLCFCLIFSFVSTTPLEIFENTAKSLYQSKNEEFSFIFHTFSLNSSSYSDIILYGSPISLSEGSSPIEVYLSTDPIDISKGIYTSVCSDILNFKPCIFNIGTSEIVKPISIYITVKCLENKCNSKIKICHLEEIHLFDKTPEIIKFSENHGILFNFTIPKADSFNRIVFTVKRNKEINNVNVFFTYGKPKTYHIGETYIGVFLNNDESLCYDCNITSFITSFDDDLIKLEYFIYTNPTNLLFEKEYYDIILNSNNTNYYEIDVPRNYEGFSYNSSFVFVFTLRNLFGDLKKFYLNPDKLPNELFLYAYNNTNDGFDRENDILVTKNDIISLNYTGYSYFLAIKSGIEGVYLLDSRFLSQPKLIIRPNMVENGIVENKMAIYYQLEIFDIEKNDGKYQISLTKESGNTNIYASICITEKECDDIVINDTLTYKTLAFYSERFGDENIIFSPKCPLNHTYCYYLFTLIGNNSLGNLNRYNFLIVKQNSTIILIENEKHETFIESNTKQAFKIIIEDSDHEIQNISISISAELDYIFTNCTEKIFNYCENCNCPEIKGNFRKPITIYKENNVFKDFNGVFFIIVFGEKTCNYNIYPQIHRKNDNEHIISLGEGKGYKGVLNEKKPHCFFEFLIDYKDSYEIEINVEAEKDKFIIYITDDGENPSPDHFLYSSKENLLHFKQEKNGKKKYLILIRAKEINNLKEDFNLEYKITASTNNTLKILEKNTVVLEYLEASKHHNFIFYYTTLEKSIDITINILSNSDNPQVLLIFIGDEVFPDKNFHIWTLNPSNPYNDSLHLTSDMLKNICPLTINNCRMFISVENNSTNTIYYRIGIRMVELALRLYGGHEEIFNIDKTEISSLFYYYPNNKTSNGIDFWIRNNWGIMVKFAIFEDIGTGIKEFLPLKQDDFFKKTDFGKNHLISFNNKTFNFCETKCVIIIEINYNISVIDKTKLLITISTEIHQIYEGKQQIFSLNMDYYKYFSFSLSEYIPQISSLTMIASLTSFSGSANIFFKLTDDNSDKKPFKDFFDYFTSTNYLILNMSFFKEKLALNRTLNPKLLIGILCTSNEGQFSFNIHTSKLQISDLFSGYPQNLILSKNSKRLFKFWNINKLQFEIKFNRVNGIGRLYMVFCPEFLHNGYTFEDCLNKPSVINKFFAGYSASNLFIDNKNLDFCVHCPVIIELECLDELKGSILVLDDGEFAVLEEGNSLFDSLDANEENRYKFNVPKNKEIQIVVAIYSGNPVLYVSPTYLENRKDCVYIQSKGENSFINFKIMPTEFQNYRFQNNFYAFVYCENNCNYSIKFDSGQVNHVLHFGTVEFGQLQALEMSSYIFYTTSNNIDKTISLNIINGILKNIFIGFSFMKKTGENTYESNFTTQPLFEHNNTEISFIFKVPQDKIGIWKIEILNNNTNSTINYSLIVNALDTTLLPFENTLQNIIEPNSYQYFEVYSPNIGFLVVDLMECSGNIDISYTTIYPNMFNHNWEGGFKSLDTQNSINILRVNKGMYYFGLKSSLNMSAFYQLTSFWYESYYDIPQNRLIIRENGIFTAGNDQKNNKNAILMYRNIICEDCKNEELENIYLIYYALISNSPFILNKFGKCGMQKHDTHNYKMKFMKNISLSESNSDEKLNKFTLENLVENNNENIYITIKIIVLNMKKTKNLVLFYNTLEYRNSFKETPEEIQLFFFFAATLGILLISTCFCLALHYWKKYKKVEMSLTYEMQDVRNMAQIRTVNEFANNNTQVNVEIEKPGKSYVGLIED